MKNEGADYWKAERWGKRVGHGWMRDGHYRGWMKMEEEEEDTIGGMKENR